MLYEKHAFICSTSVVRERLGLLRYFKASSTDTTRRLQSNLPIGGPVLNQLN